MGHFRLKMTKFRFRKVEFLVEIGILRLSTGDDIFSKTNMTGLSLRVHPSQSVI